MRWHAAPDPAIAAERLSELLADGDRVIVRGATANPALPVPTMLSIPDATGL